MNKVSVVIPVKNSHDHIHACVESLLAQEYDAFEVIVVGDKNDTSWPALADIPDERLVRVPVEVSMNGATRDANLKRNIGLSLATGDVLAMTDSDMVLRQRWIADGVALTTRYPVVASSMISLSEGFLGQYIDKNVIGSRTPRFNQDYVLNADNYGRSGFKPPVTANLFLRREVLTATGGPSASFTRSYEDYEWARRIVDAGFSILTTSALAGYHDHRTGMRQMVRDYKRSGRGCADYIVTYPYCRLAKTRARQAGVITGAIPAGAAALAINAASTVAAAGIFSLIVMMISVLRVKTLASLLYPWVSLTLGLTFWWGLTGQLLQNLPSVTLGRASLPLPIGSVATPMMHLTTDSFFDIAGPDERKDSI